MTRARRAGLGLGLGAVVMVGAVLLRALPRERIASAADGVPAVEFEAGPAVERFAQGLRFRTISHPRDSGIPHDAAAFRALHGHLKASFPHAHGALRRETVAGLSLLYTWPGADPSLEPLVLLSHLDVVPVEEATANAWTHPPFGGEVADGSIWGRGALDDKAGVFGLLQAVDALVARGFEPRRGVHLAFGHDEEVGGHEGAAAIAALLAERGVRAWMVLDEGGAVSDGMLPGADFPTAAIAVGEKGYLSLALIHEGPGGHSSAPPAQSAVGIVAQAVRALEQSPFPARLAAPTRGMVEQLGAHLSYPWRVVTQNLWLFEPLVERAMLSAPSSAALLRTTTAATIFRAGVKENVLPARAEAVVNFRILPGDTVDDVIAHAERVIDDPRVRIEPRSGGRGPSALSPTDSEAFRALERAIAQSFPDAVAIPVLSAGGTDARHYERLSPHVYRFLPAKLDESSFRGFHGTDEHLGVEAYLEAVRFYARLIRSAAGPAAGG